jgi:hypothetical protein
MLMAMHSVLKQNLSEQHTCTFNALVTGNVIRAHIRLPAQTCSPYVAIVYVQVVGVIRGDDSSAYDMYHRISMFVSVINPRVIAATLASLHL